MNDEMRIKARHCRLSCERRGLKLLRCLDALLGRLSPLMREAWIETILQSCILSLSQVASHARGVD